MNLPGHPPFIPLLPDSPIIDKGNPAIPGSDVNACKTTDARGVSRPAGSACDIGAYEVAEASEPSQMFITSPGNFRTPPNLPFPLPVTVFVSDDFLSPVVGYSVTFTGPSSGASIDPNGLTAITDNQGFASVRPTANNQIGDYEITATAEGIDPVAFSVSHYAWYVSPTGNDSNDCLGPLTACASINTVLSKSSFMPLDTILMESGDYNNSGTDPNGFIYLNKSVRLSGGWDSGFSTQDDVSTINANQLTRGIKLDTGITGILENLLIINGVANSSNGSDGGGILALGPLTLSRSSVQNNFASNNGGGIYISVSLVMDHTAIANNFTGNFGGGIYSAPFSSTRIDRSVVLGNETSHDGGGIYTDDMSHLFIQRSSITHNGAGDGSGGGIFADWMNIENTTLSNNMAGNGGGLYGSGDFNNVTIVNNSASYGGGIQVADVKKTHLSNSIIAQNQAMFGPDCRQFPDANIFISNGYNFIGDNRYCNIDPTTGDQFGTGDAPLNPMLSTLKDFGDGTYSHMPFNGSPVLDAGNPATPGNGEGTCTAKDQANTDRPQGAACDIGAIEGSATPTIEPQINIFDGFNTDLLPGIFLCDINTFPCTFGRDTDADTAQENLLETFNYFQDHDGWNSMNGLGMPVNATVHYSTDFDNAMWDGYQIDMGDNWTDLETIAHEYTHGVVQYTANLFYYYQSGAISESLADLWGELIEQEHEPGQDWLLGEVIPDYGPLGSMANPPQYKQPDRMQSSFYYKGTEDSGGVHINAGVNNKAAYLMVEGGTFNGKTVLPLGKEKTEVIYWETLTNLLTSGADYNDLYYALNQGCVNLANINAHGITLADCQQVSNATLAVQMNLSPSLTYNPEGSYCSTGLTKSSSDLFFDDFETDDSQWEFATEGNPHLWGRQPTSVYIPYAASGKYLLFGNDYNSSYGGSSQNTDSYATLLNNVHLTVKSSIFLHFKHAFGFEFSGSSYYDGGRVEYSIDNGTTWKDLAPLFSSGKNYGGVIAKDVKNPIQGLSAFVGTSHGYVSSTYNLTTLADKDIRIRFHMGTDFINSDVGWAIDDVEIYTCIGQPTIPSLKAPVNGSLLTNYQPKLDWNDSTPGLLLDHYNLQIDEDKLFTLPIKLDINLPHLGPSDYSLLSSLDSNKTYYWRIQAVNSAGAPTKWSTIYSFRTPMNPPMPLLPVNNINTNRPTFTWNSVPGATGYSIQVSSSLMFTPLLINAIVSGNTTLLYTPSISLPINTSLYWRVKANGTNVSNWSDPLTFLTSGIPPNAPTLSNPVTNSLQTNLSPTLDWNASTMPTTSTATFDRYQVQVSMDSNFNSTSIDALTTAGDISAHQFVIGSGSTSPLLPNLKYYWKVRSYDSLGLVSGWSSTFVLRTALAAPTSLSAIEPNSIRPTFDWVDVPGITGYSIQVSKNNTFTSLINTTTVKTSQFTPTTNLPVNTPIWWRVRSLGTNGPSLWSELGSSFTTVNPPSTPILVSPLTNSLQTNLSPILDWKTSVIPLTSAATFDHYDVQVATETSFTSPYFVGNTLPGDITLHQLDISSGSPSSLQPNTKYYWRVRSVDSFGGMSAWSSPFILRSALPSPSGLTLTEENSLRPKFDWSDVPGVTGYNIQLSKNSTFTLLIGTTLVKTSENIRTANLPVNTQIWWRVQSLGVNGPSLWTIAGTTFTTPNPPSVPTLVSPANNSATYLFEPRFDWTNSTVLLGVPFVQYRLQVAKNAAFTDMVVDQTISGITNSEYTLTTPLLYNFIYYWRVRAETTAGAYAAWSPTYIVKTTVEKPDLLGPVNDAYYYGPKMIFHWTEVDDAVNYTLQISTSASMGSPKVFTTDNPYLPVTLSYLKYYWRVRANGVYGPGAWSDVWHFTFVKP